VCGSYAAALQKSNAARSKWLRWSVIDSGVGRGEERGKVAEACRLFAEEGCSTAQASDSEGTRKRFFCRCRPWEGETATGRCLAQRSSADRSGMHLYLDVANQVHAQPIPREKISPDPKSTFSMRVAQAIQIGGLRCRGVPNTISIYTLL
jgi:hypothetical protein